MLNVLFQNVTNIDEKLFLLGTGATSVRYLSVEGLVSAVRGVTESQEKDDRISSNTKTSRLGHCTACLTGKYPVELEW